jgi:Na+/proline symporter
MGLHAIDLAIIAAYLVAVVFVGFYLSRRASEDIDSYFLGGNDVPWWVLGTSNASSMFDITGTMWIVSLLFVYGMKGVWIPWLWPLFNQVFLMIYVATWIRRSGVLTGAEWMTTRFGKETGGELARISVLVFALVSVIGFLSYAFQGIGKFSAVFFPFGWEPEVYACIFMGVCAVYVVLGGMYSVVFTDVIQFLVLTIGSIIVGYVAFTTVSPAELAASVPNGWKDLFFGWRLDLDWSNQLPQVNDRIQQDGYEFFTIFMMMVLFKGFLVSAAGPAPNYDMQRVLAARDSREAALMSGFVSVCTTPRWLLIGGITTLGAVSFQSEMAAMGGSIDFEMLLPWVIRDFVPVGLTGLLLAGLLAAFMSTFDSTVNAGAAYLVNDVLKRYLLPDASERTYVLASYAASFLLVAVGIGFGLMSRSIDSVTQWIVSGLYGGYAAPNLLKWHWWRLNGAGYFSGMIGGMVVALAMPVLFPEMSALSSFPYILVVSIATSVAGSYATPPTRMAVLRDFYMSVCPWGLWGPVREAAQAKDPEFEPNANAGRDAVNVLVGIAWQTALFVAPVALLFFDYATLAGALAVAGVTTFFLKRNWYDRLADAPTSDAARQRARQRAAEAAADAAAEQPAASDDAAPEVARP